MANKILVARGTKARIEEIKSTLAVNELVYSTDTGELGVKKANGNIEYFKNAADIDASKQDKLVAGTNITINPITNVISASGTGGGDGTDLDTIMYMNYASDIFYREGNRSLFSNAWQDMKNSETVLFDIPLALAAPNQDFSGFNVDLYVGTNDQLQALYDACANETIRPPIDGFTADTYYVNNVATFYAGDVGGDVGFPIPLYSFGLFGPDDNTAFVIGDLTPLQMGLGLVLAKFVNVSIPNNNIIIQKGFGFEFEKENGIIIPNSVTSIGSHAFYYWTSNNQPLVIPSSVTEIGELAFGAWISNNQPLVIPESVTSIGDQAFYAWTSAKEFIMESETPPTITYDSFYNTNNAPIYVPNDSVEAYKTATNWVDLADRIFPISDRTSGGSGGSEYELTKSKIETALVGSDTGSIQLGENTTASGSSSIALGSSASASSFYSTALGRNSKASGPNSTALGWGATASRGQSTAVGPNASAEGSYSTALGYGATASGLNSIAIGRDTTVTEDNVVDFGSDRQVRVNLTPVNDRDAVSKSYLEASDFTTTTYVDNKTTIKEQNTNTDIKFWTGSLTEYNSLSVKDENTLYFIKEE